MKGLRGFCFVGSKGLRAKGTGLGFRVDGFKSGFGVQGLWGVG